MKKKFMVLVVALCLALSVGLLAACGGKPETPEGGSWTVWSENKIYTKNLKLVFEDEETFKVYYGSDNWITGRYAFADKPGTSTLTLSNAGTALVGVAENAEKTYEPTDGVYTIQFDHGGGGKSNFKFQPPQDGTKPGEETPTCTEHIDANYDEKCDVCDADVPATTVVTLTALNGGEYYQFPAKLTMKSNGKFLMEIAYYAVDDVDQYMTAATGSWAQIDAENPMAGITITYDVLYVSTAGETDTISVAMSADYTKIEYAVTIEYNTAAQGENPAMNMVFNFSGELAISA